VSLFIGFGSEILSASTTNHNTYLFTKKDLDFAILEKAEKNRDACLH